MRFPSVTCVCFCMCVGRCSGIYGSGIIPKAENSPFTRPLTIGREPIHGKKLLENLFTYLLCTYNIPAKSASYPVRRGPATFYRTEKR